MLYENYQTALKNVKDALARAGRSDTVEIVAASKTQPIEVINAAAQLGIVAFGENRVQELINKYTPDLTWDMIGQLQTNKVKYLIGKVRLIASVDRVPLLEAIQKEAQKHGIVQDILIEVNGGEELGKGGVLPQNALELALLATKYSNIRVRGLMAVMPVCAEREALCALYRRVSEVFCAVKQQVPTANLFSAGMSNDYPIAIEYGANMIRLGRALFGERE